MKEFPYWTPLNMGSYSSIVSHPSWDYRNADFNPINLIAWNTNNEGYVSSLYDNLLLRLPDYITGQSLYSFMGSNRIVETAELLLGESHKLSGSPKLDLVPEPAAQALKNSGLYCVMEDPDNHDYVLSTNAIVNFSGSNFRHYRRAVRGFEASFGSRTDFCMLDIRMADNQAAVSDVFMVREGYKSGEYHSELVALHRLFDCSRRVSFLTFGLRVDSKLVAFIICEILRPGWAIGHFWKADTAHKGIYSYLMYRTARVLLRHGVQYLNIEQDLGIVNLRTAKQFLHPYFFVNKYRVLPLVR